VFHRVRRDEVQSPASSRSPSPAHEAELQDAHDRLGKLLNLDSILGTNETQEQEGREGSTAGDNDDDEQEFEFRLFSAPTKSKDTTEKAPPTEQKDTSKGEEGQKKKTPGNEGTQKLRIRLRSPTPVSARPEDGRFVKAFRGWQYYFTTPSLYGLKDDSDTEARLSEMRRQYEDTAVTGDHITSWAKAQPWVCRATSLDISNPNNPSFGRKYWLFLCSAWLWSVMAGHSSQETSNKIASSR